MPPHDPSATLDACARCATVGPGYALAICLVITRGTSRTRGLARDSTGATGQSTRHAGANPDRPTEVSMASTDASPSSSIQMPEAGTVDMKLEVVTLPVSDVDRAKRFYQSLGWRLDADIVRGDAFRAVQLTPTHSGCSVAFGTGLTTDEPRPRVARQAAASSE